MKKHEEHSPEIITQKQVVGRKEQERYKEIERYRTTVAKKMQIIQRQMSETDRAIKDFAMRFNSIVDNFYDLLTTDSSLKLFRRIGYNIHSTGKSIVKKSKKSEEYMHLDAILHNDTTLIAVNMEWVCHKNNIDNFLRETKKLKSFFPEYKDKEVLLSIAAINYEDNADVYAHNLGLIVIRTDGYNFFSIDPCNRETLVKF